MCSKSYVTLLVGTSHSFSWKLTKFADHNRFGISLDLARLSDQSALWFYGRNLLVVYPYFVNFGSYGHCGSGYVIILVCHVISLDSMFICSSDL